MIIEQITSPMSSAMKARGFASHTTTFIPIIIKLKDGRYTVAKEVSKLDSKNKFIFAISASQIIDPALIKDGRGRPAGIKEKKKRVYALCEQRNVNDKLPIEQTKEVKTGKVSRFPAGWSGL
ncbi:MAG: hypothetical protein IMZ53_13010 [Thermoplasmata archaeon]|nr:hypothetical protein [Thermoplasmata archaeon]